MKIKTANNDNYASADIDYLPSLCFEPVYSYLNYECYEDDKNIFDGMSRKIALFIDMLEIVNMSGPSTAMCFSRAFEGLADGMAADLAINYGIYNGSEPLEELIVKLKKEVYKEREKIIKEEYFEEE